MLILIVLLAVVAIGVTIWALNGNIYTTTSGSTYNLWYFAVPLLLLAAGLAWWYFRKKKS